MQGLPRLFKLAFRNHPACRRLLLPSLLIAVLCYHVWSLLRVPKVVADEGWFASRAWALLDTGRPFGPLDAGVIDRFEGYSHFLPQVPTWLQAGALAIAGKPSLLALRAVSLAAGFLLLGAVGLLGRRFGGVACGWLSVFALALSPNFFLFGHIARVDVLAAALGYAALALTVAWPRRPATALTAGLLCGVAFEVHLHSAILALACLVLQIRARTHGAPWRQRPLMALVAGGAIGGLFYAALHVLPNPRSYFALNSLIFGPTHTPPLLTFDIVEIARALVDMAELVVGTTHVVLWPLLPLSCLLAFRTGQRRERDLLLLLATVLVGATFLWRNKVDYYGILVAPALDLLLAWLLAHTLRWKWSGSFQRLVVTAAAWGLFLASVILTLRASSEDWQSNYARAVTAIDKAIRPDDLIMGPQTYWFGFTRQPYRSWEQLVYYRRLFPNATLEEAFETFHPDIFILDASFDRWFLPANARNSLYDRHMSLSGDEALKFFQDHGSEVARCECPAYGPIRVIRLRWPK
jgi:4-amino-4-deoxy-L-arabinose transferase-like glycosyltransferase